MRNMTQYSASVLIGWQFIHIVSGIGINLALNKPSTQISTSDSANASRAVDGNSDPHYPNGSCTATRHQTPSEPYLWWQVDLGCSLFVSEVVITNRNYAGERLHDFDILLADNVTMNEALVCRHYPGPLGTGLTETLPCHSPLSGRYLRVQIPWNNDTDLLTLCEVQVMGVPNKMALTRQTNKRVTSNKLRMMTSSLEMCARACQEGLQCVGFNFSPLAANMSNCELLASTINVVTDADWSLYVANSYDVCSC
ncbi:fucolectin-4-like [Haliotis rufescens]|uniref:fucolectin-4-like n=1 Tax=Haliotis rufescens TaxID=6454 RepID=UPI00201F5562|nr:fucolectin-4-like [Haliotis rufescens]